MHVIVLGAGAAAGALTPWLPKLARGSWSALCWLAGRFRGSPLSPVAMRLLLWMDSEAVFTAAGNKLDSAKGQRLLRIDLRWGTIEVDGNEISRSLSRRERRAVLARGRELAGEIRERDRLQQLRAVAAMLELLFPEVP